CVVCIYLALVVILRWLPHPPLRFASGWIIHPNRREGRSSTAIPGSELCHLLLAPAGCVFSHGHTYLPQSTRRAKGINLGARQKSGIPSELIPAYPDKSDFCHPELATRQRGLIDGW